MNETGLYSSNRFEGQSLVVNSNSLNDQLKKVNNNFIQTFSIDSPTPELIIRVDGIDTKPIFEVTLPDSTVIDQQNVNMFTNIEISENSDENKVFYAFSNPILGAI